MKRISSERRDLGSGGGGGTSVGGGSWSMFCWTSSIGMKAEDGRSMDTGKANKSKKGLSNDEKWLCFIGTIWTLRFLKGKLSTFGKVVTFQQPMKN